MVNQNHAINTRISSNSCFQTLVEIMWKIQHQHNSTKRQSISLTLSENHSFFMNVEYIPSKNNTVIHEDNFNLHLESHWAA